MGGVHQVFVANEVLRGPSSSLDVRQFREMIDARYAFLRGQKIIALSDQRDDSPTGVDLEGAICVELQDHAGDQAPIVVEPVLSESDGAPFDAVVADAAWALDRWGDGNFKFFNASHVGVFNKRVFAIGNDSNRLLEIGAEKYKVPKERIVTKYVAPEDPNYVPTGWVEFEGDK